MSLKSEAAFTIQQAEERHARAIQRLVLTSGINPTALDWRRFYIAITDDGEFIGCGKVKPHGDGSHELASLAVKKEWRRRGVATALMQALLSQHPQELHLMCQSSLGPLYENFGFEVIDEDEMPTYFRRVSKLASVIESLRKQGKSLLIMRRSV